MNKRILVRAALVLPLALATGALAETYKCKAPNGKITYSDEPCEGAARAPAPAAAKPAEGARYELTSADRERIKTLDALVVAPDTTAELKTGAQLEISNIRRGAEVLLTPDERKRREALTVDLSSADRKKRADALATLRTLYDR